MDLTSLQLQLNHTKLQLQAILLNEKKLQSECAQLQHKLAVTEQDKLLIEVSYDKYESFVFIYYQYTYTYMYV